MGALHGASSFRAAYIVVRAVFTERAYPPRVFKCKYFYVLRAALD